MATIKSGSSTDQAFVSPQNALKVDNSAVTQPVSISGTVPVSGPLTDTQLRASAPHVVVDTAPTTAVTGTFFQATQPVSAASLPLPANAAQETGGNLAAISTAMTNGTAKTQTVNGSGVVADVSAKGVQGANALATQDLNDAGRVIKIFQAVFTPAAAEAMVILTPVSDGTAGGTGTSFTVTAGKRLRLQALMLSIENTTAAIRGCQVSLRMSASGAVTTASPIIGAVGATTSAATLQLAAAQAQSFPDGVELSGTMQLGISAIGTALAGSTVTVIGYEY